MAQQRLGVTTVLHPRTRPKTKCECGAVMTQGTTDLHLTGCARKGNHVIPHNLLRDELHELAGRAYLQAEREPTLVGRKEADGKALRADLRVCINQGQYQYFDGTVVSLYRKDVRKMGIADKRKKYKAINSQNQNGHVKVKPLVVDAVGGMNRDLERLTDEIGHWRLGEKPLPMGTLNWAISTPRMYVRAAVVTKVLHARARCLLQLRAAAHPIE